MEKKQEEVIYGCQHENRVYICKMCMRLICYCCMNEHTTKGHIVHHSDEIRDATKSKADSTIATLRVLQEKANKLKQDIQPLGEESKNEYIRIYQLGIKINEIIRAALFNAREYRNNIPKTIEMYMAECNNRVKRLEEAIAKTQSLKDSIEPALAEKKVLDAVACETIIDSILDVENKESDQCARTLEAQLKYSRSVIDIIHTIWDRTDKELQALSAQLTTKLLACQQEAPTPGRYVSLSRGYQQANAYYLCITDNTPYLH